MKLPKKLSVKTWYNIGIALVLAVLAYSFHGVYSLAANYLNERKLPPKEAVKPNPVPPPEFFRFAPPPQQLYRYAVFTMNREALNPAQNEAAAKISSFDILGVVKRDQLFLVVRIKPSGKIQLVAQGEAVNGESTVKDLTTSSVVLQQKDGGEKVHKIFAFNGVTEQIAPANRANRKKQNKKKQAQKNNEGRSF